MYLQYKAERREGYSETVGVHALTTEAEGSDALVLFRR